MKIFQILNLMKIKKLMKILIPINYKLNNPKLIQNINNADIAKNQIVIKFGLNLIRANIIIVLSVFQKNIYIQEKNNATFVVIKLKFINLINKYFLNE